MTRSTSQIRAIWDPACTNHRGLMRTAYRALDLVMAKWGYRPRAGVTGAANCRRITGGSGYSLHAYFDGERYTFWTDVAVTMAVAVDINWDKNPYGKRLVTDMPRGMIDEILDIRTGNGVQVWGWGGNYRGNKDAMHFEILASPAELATGIRVGLTHHPEVHPVTGSRRVAGFSLKDGRDCVVFEDGGVWVSPQPVVPGAPGANELSCAAAVASRRGKVTDAWAAGDGIKVLSEDGHIDTRYAVHLGNAT